MCYFTLKHARAMPVGNALQYLSTEYPLYRSLVPIRVLHAMCIIIVFGGHIDDSRKGTTEKIKT